MLRDERRDHVYRFAEADPRTDCDGYLVLRHILPRPPTHKIDAPGDGAMLADHEWQQMFELAQYLHPDGGVAFAVTLEARDRIALLHKETGSTHRALPAQAPRGLSPRYGVYLASDMRERAQERPL